MFIWLCTRVLVTFAIVHPDTYLGRFQKMSSFSSLRAPKGFVRIARDELRFRKTFRKYKKFTMVPEHIYTGNLHLAATIKSIPGDIVECGTWRGGMIAGLADTLGPNRHYRLFDSFEGMPPAKEIDGKVALAWQSDTSDPYYHDNCRASEEQARRAMSMSVATDYTIVKGWFRETLPVASVAPIALLRLDCDWYDSVKDVLDNLANRVVRGGLLVVDGYYAFEGCTLAVNEYATARKGMLRQSRWGGVCHMVVQ
jgi:O-methyltransferase